MADRFNRKREASRLSFFLNLKAHYLWALLLCLPLPVAVLTPLLPVRSYYDLSRWGVISLSICFLLFALPRATAPLLKVPSLALLAALFTGVLSTLLHGFDPATGNGFFLIWEVIFWSVPVVVGSVLAQRFGVDGLSRLMVNFSYTAGAVAVAYSVVIILGLVFWYTLGASDFENFIPMGFYNIRFWSHLASWLFPWICLSAFLAHRSGRSGIYWLLLIAGGLWLMAALGSGARGHLLAIVTSLLIVSFYAKDFRTEMLKTIFKIIVLGSLFYLVFAILIPQTLSEGTLGYRGDLARKSSSGRLDLWLLALTESLRHFPLGIGALQFSQNPASAPFATPHGAYFRWVAEYGWLSFALFSFACLSFGRNFLRAMPAFECKGHPRVVSLVLFWSILSGLFHAAISGIFANSSSMLVALPVLTLVVAVASVQKPELRAYTQIRAVPLGLTLVLLITSALSLPGTYQWWQATVEDQSRYVDEEAMPLAPRFWLHGRYRADE